MARKDIDFNTYVKRDLNKTTVDWGTVAKVACARPRRGLKEKEEQGDLLALPAIGRTVNSHLAALLLRSYVLASLSVRGPKWWRYCPQQDRQLELRQPRGCEGKDRGRHRHSTTPHPRK